MVGALLLVEEEALHVQKAFLQVVPGVVKGKPAVAGKAQGEEGSLGLGLPQVDLHPVSRVAEGHLRRGFLLQPGQGNHALGANLKFLQSAFEAQPGLPGEGS